MVFNGPVVILDKFIPEFPHGFSTGLIVVMVVYYVRLSNTRKNTGNWMLSKMLSIDLTGGNLSVLSLFPFAFPFFLSYCSFSYLGLKITWYPHCGAQFPCLPPSLSSMTPCPPHIVSCSTTTEFQSLQKRISKQIFSRHFSWEVFVLLIASLVLFSNSQYVAYVFPSLPQLHIL